MRPVSVFSPNETVSAAVKSESSQVRTVPEPGADLSTMVKFSSNVRILSQWSCDWPTGDQPIYSPD